MWGTADGGRSLLEEVEELTVLLRDDREWDELRRVLRRRRVRPADVLLAAFLEDGDGMEYGVLVTADCGVIKYQRRIARPGRRPRVIRWLDRTDDPSVVGEFPQVAVALDMQRA